MEVSLLRDELSDRVYRVNKSSFPDHEQDLLLDDGLPVQVLVVRLSQFLEDPFVLRCLLHDGVDSSIGQPERLGNLRLEFLLHQYCMGYRELFRV